MTIARGRSRSSTIRRHSPQVIILTVLLCVSIIPPFVFLAYSSLHELDPSGAFGAFTFGHFAAIFSSRTLNSVLFNSAVYSLGSALLALVIGAAQAWLAERTDASLRQVLYVASIVSLGIPYVLYIVAWILLLGKAGPVNVFLQEIFGGVGPYINIYSLGGMIFVEGLLWSPLAFLLLSPVFRNSDASFEEAASICGAGLLSTLRHITLGMARPALLALGLLVFIKASESFEVPALVGLPGRISVLTTDIYTNMVARAPPDIGGASALSVLMLLLVFLLLSIYNRLSRHAERFATITGKGFRPRPFDLGRLRYVAAGILIFNFVLLLLVPMLMLVWVSLLPFFQPVSAAALKLVSLNNYLTVLESGQLELMLNTMLVAVATATIAVGLTFVAGWLAVRRAPGGWIVDRLATIPLVFPGLILGIAVMQLFLAVPIPIYGTLGILVWAFVINYLPYGMRYSASGMLQIHRELEEAAAICGATPLTRLRRIVAPLLAPALLAGWLFIFLMSARALSLPILLSGPRSQLMAVAMFDLWGNGQGTELAALGLMWSMLMTTIALVFYVVARRSAGGALGRA